MCCKSKSVNSKQTDYPFYEVLVRQFLQFLWYETPISLVESYQKNHLTMLALVLSLLFSIKLYLV